MVTLYLAIATDRLAAPAGGAGAARSSSLSSEPYSPERLAQARAERRPVFVNMTAAWCITRQHNKKPTLADPTVLADFQPSQCTLLRADWTRRDPAITQALEQLGRSGVPVYVLYQKGQQPVVFSEILQAQDLRQALTRL